MYNQTTEVIKQLTKENVKAIAQESAKWRTVPLTDKDRQMLTNARKDSGTMERFLKVLRKLDQEYNKFTTDTYKKQARIMLAQLSIAIDFKEASK